MQKTKTLVGLAVDVSGSMETSIRNEVDGELSRFESFQKALDRLLDEVREVMRSRQDRQEGKVSVDLFVYCFGLKDEAIEIADLLSLMKMGDSGIRKSKQQEEQYRASESRHSLSKDPFEDLEHIARNWGRDGWCEWAKKIFTAQQAQALVDQLRDGENAEKMASYLPTGLTAELAQKVSKAGDELAQKVSKATDLTGNIANSLGLGNIANSLELGSLAAVGGRMLSETGGRITGITAKLEKAENFAKKLIQQKGIDAQFSTKDEIRRRVSQHLKEQLNTIGDTTLSLSEVADLWSQSEIFLQDFEDMVYGSTPMCKMLRTIKERFDRELSKQKENSDLVLFLLSDGQPTDGNPLPIVEELKEMGVSIICCLLDSKDVSDPQILFNQPDQSWDNNACLMFEMASPVEEKSHFARFLLKKRWTINSQAKMFVQLNHSKVLEEFIQIILSPLDQEISDPMPRGDQ